MSKLNIENLTVWEGSSHYNGTTYSVTVFAPSDSYKGDVIRAVGKAGGRYVELDETAKSSRAVPREDIFSVTLSSATYMVRFTPNPRLTSGFISKTGAEVLLDGSFGKIHDGNLQKAKKTASPSQAAQAQHAGRINIPIKRI